MHGLRQSQSKSLLAGSQLLAIFVPIGRSMERRREIVSLARATGIRLMIGCMTETSVAFSVASQLAPVMKWADQDGNILAANDCFSGMELSREMRHTYEKQ